MLIIKEGNAGIYRSVAKIANGKDYTVDVDLGATYREYYLKIEPTFECILTSDHCLDHASITVESRDGEFELKWTARNSHSWEPTPPSESFGTEAGRWLRKLWSGGPDS